MPVGQLWAQVAAACSCGAGITTTATATVASPPYSTTGRARRREATHVILPAADPAAGAARAVSRDPGPGLAREGRGPEGFLPRLSVAVPRGLAHP